MSDTVVVNAHVESDHCCDLFCSCDCLVCQEERAEMRARLAEERRQARGTDGWGVRPRRAAYTRTGW